MRRCALDDGLVERARNGDVLAFEALVAARVEAMGRTAMAILGDVDEAREATQDSLLTIWRELPALRDDDRFDAWAGRILVNRCRLSLKRRRRRLARELPLDEATRLGEADHGVPEAVHRRAELERAFEGLDPDGRALLVLHHLDGIPVAEIALRLGIPVGTAKSRLFTARRALERALEAEA